MSHRKLERQLRVGEKVVYFDEFGREHDALVTAVWGERTEGETEQGAYLNEPGCNLLFISPDAKREDSYGRQIERRSSCVHVMYQAAYGNCYCLPEQIDSAREKVEKAKAEFRDA